MRKVTRSQVLWIASAAALTVAAAVVGCGNSSSGGNNNDDEGGLSSSSSGAGSSGAASSGTGSSGAGSSSGASSGGGSSSGISDASMDAKSDGGAVVNDGGAEAASEEASTEAGASSDAGDASCGTTLNVYNDESWCSVSVNGGAFKTDGMQTVCVAPGSIPLVAEPKNSTFELGTDPWLYISGTGGTDSGISGAIVGDGGVGSTSTTSINVGSTTACVFVCCPFSNNGSGCTGLTNPCL